MSSKRSNRFFDLFDDSTHEESTPDSSFKRSGQQNAPLKKLHTQIQSRLDFHGKTVAEAIHILEGHLYSHPHAHVCLLIHGKGYASGSKLKRELLQYLTSHSRCFAYLPAPPSKGADGASIARFTKRR